MSLTGTLSIGCSIGGRSAAAVIQVASGQEILIEEAIANGQSNFIINTLIPTATLKQFFLMSDRAVTVKTNNNVAGDNAFILVANQPVPWFVGALWANPVTVDIGSLHVANASGATANLILYAVVDGSP